MLAVEFPAPGSARLAEMPRPRVSCPTDAVVMVTTAAIGDDDLRRYRAGDPAGPTPGLEFSGVVEEIGADVQRLDIGEIVTAAHRICGRVQKKPGHGGAQAGWVLVRDADRSLVPVSPGIEERALLLGDTYGRGMDAARLASESATPDGGIALLGCDLHVLSALIALKRLRAAWRPMLLLPGAGGHCLAVAKRLGAEVIDSAGALRETNIRALIAGFSASEDEVRAAAQELPRDARLVLPAPHSADPSVLGLAVARAARPESDCIRQMARDLAGGSLDLGPLVSHVMPLEQAAEAYEVLADGGVGVLKVLLKP